MRMNMQMGMRGLRGLNGVPLAQPFSETFTVCASGSSTKCDHPKTLNALLNDLLIQVEGNVGQYVGFGNGAGLASDLAAFDAVATSFCAALVGTDQSCSTMDVAGLVAKYKQSFVDFLKGNIATDYYAGTSTLYMLKSGSYTLWDYASGAVKPSYNPGPSTTPTGSFDISRAGGSGTQGGGPVLTVASPSPGGVLYSPTSGPTVNPVTTSPTSGQPTGNLVNGQPNILSTLSDEAKSLLSGMDNTTLLLIAAGVVGLILFTGSKK